MKEVTPIHHVHKNKSRHRHFLLLLIPSIVFTLTLVFIYKDRWKAPLNSIEVHAPMETRTIKVGEVFITTKVAKTTEEHSKGLSGVVSLSENEGMLFVFPSKARPAFWMKQMLIPLDFIWIKDGVVSQIHKNVQAPPIDTPETKLSLYIPDDLVDYVLEVNANFSDKNNIKVGDIVDIGAL